MGKSSKKSNVEVAPAAVAVPSAKSAKKGGKRNSDQVIATSTNAKKHKVAVAVPKKNGKKSKKVKAPAKVTNKPAKPAEKEVSSSDESESSDEEMVKKDVPAKKQPSTLDANGMEGNAKTEQFNSNAERDSDSEDEKDDEDEDDDSDESSADELLKEQKNKPKVESNKSSDSEDDSSEESEEGSEDESVKKPKKKVNPQHLLPSERRTLESFHIEMEAIRQEQNVLHHMFTENAKQTRKYLEDIMSKLDCSSSGEDDSSDSEEESEDEPVKKPKKKVNAHAQLLLPSEFDTLRSCQLEMKAIVQEQSALCRMLTENVKQVEKCVKIIMSKLKQMAIYLIMSRLECPSSSGDDSSEESEDDSSQESEDDSCEGSEDETVKKPKKKLNSQPLLPSKPHVLESFRLLIEASRREQNAFRRMFIKNAKLTKYLKSIMLKLDWSSSSEED